MPQYKRVAFYPFPVIHKARSQLNILLLFLLIHNRHCLPPFPIPYNLHDKLFSLSKFPYIKSRVTARFIVAIVILKSIAKFIKIRTALFIRYYVHTIKITAHGHIDRIKKDIMPGIEKPPGRCFVYSIPAVKKSICHSAPPIRQNPRGRYPLFHT